MASTSSAVRLVPESLSGVVSRSCSSWRRRGAGPRPGGRRARRRGARGPAGRRATRPRPARRRWCRSRRWRSGARRAAARTAGSSARSMRGGVVLRHLGDAVVLGEDVAGGLALGLRHAVGAAGVGHAGRRRGRGSRSATGVGPALPGVPPPCAGVRRRTPGGHGRATAGVARAPWRSQTRSSGSVPRSAGGPARRSGSTPTARSGRWPATSARWASTWAWCPPPPPAVRASGRELPERIPFGDAALLTVATFRLARRIAKDPVTAPLRAPFTRFEGPSGHAEVAEEVREHGGVKHAVGELLTCPFCLAQWVGTGFVFGYVTAPEGHPAGGADDDDGGRLRRPAVRVRRDPERRRWRRRPRGRRPRPAA